MCPQKVGVSGDADAIVLVLLGELVYYDEGGVWIRVLIRRRRRRSLKWKADPPSQILGHGEQGLYQTFSW